MPRILTSAYLDEEVEEDDGPWFALMCKPFFCTDCKQTQMFLHIFLDDNHAPIVIFDHRDDEILLESAIMWQRQDRNPKVIDYDPDMGLSITVYDVRKIVGI